MRFINKTDFPADVFENYASDAERYTVVAIRATYELVMTGKETAELIVAEKQDPLLWEDEYEETLNGLMLVKQSDFIPYKEATDVTLEGVDCIYAPDAKEDHYAELTVRGVKKKLLLHGTRFLQQLGINAESGWQLSSENQNCESVPIKWDLAYGGKVQNATDGQTDKFNPIGIGNIDFSVSGGNQAYLAPQIEYAEDPHLISPDRKTPAGFGAIAPSWRWRSRYAGTYDKIWEENIKPFRPLDFDYKFWNCAPPDQQFAPYLQPGDEIELINLHPKFKMISFAVPEDIFACASLDVFKKREVEHPVLDGVHIDLKRGKYFTVNFCWRTRLQTGAGLRRITLFHGKNNSEITKQLAGEVNG